MVKIADDETCPCGSEKRFGDCHGREIRERAAARITRHIALTVIPRPDPNSRSVFELTGEGTVIFSGGYGGDSLDCGRCGQALAVGIERDQFQNLVFKCNGCGSFNET